MILVFMNNRLLSKKHAIKHIFKFFMTFLHLFADSVCTISIVHTAQSQSETQALVTLRDYRAVAVSSHIL